jgi:hypothetical protein
MAHCGFEGTAVDDAFAHPLKALKVALFGPKVAGPMAPELPFTYTEAPGAASPLPAVISIPVGDVQRIGLDDAAPLRAGAPR